MNNRGKGKIVVIIIIALVILALGGLAAYWIFMTPGYISRDQAVSNYYQAISSEDKELYKNTCYTSAWQNSYANNTAGIGMDAAVDMAYEFQSGASYGDVKITALEKLDSSYADKMEESIKSLYGIDLKISAISKVNFSVKTTFEGAKEDSGTLTRYVYKSGGKWFFLADPDIIVLLDL
ncbi:hypothetical protein SAMN06297422_12931 [Lachnospiraceae bacterium]|nr:hypothetical protein SAMN06297422_12931 [Lachnospiraceae bacterium]